MDCEIENGKILEKKHMKLMFELNPVRNDANTLSKYNDLNIDLYAKSLKTCDTAKRSRVRSNIS